MKAKSKKLSPLEKRVSGRILRVLVPFDNQVRIKILKAATILLGIPDERQCVHCGCTDSRACPGGCSWAIKHKRTNTGVCSQCIAKEFGIADLL